MEQVEDDAISYQLEKVDQGGAISDLFEMQVEELADAWGYQMTEGWDEIVLPDGRIAGLSFKAYIRDPNEKRTQKEEPTRKT